MPILNTLTVSIPSDKKYLERIEDFVSAVWNLVAREEEESRRRLMEYQIKLAIHETCLNVIQHAYENDPTQEILIECHVFSERVEFHIIDYGKSYDYVSRARPGFSDVPQEKGYGLPLIFALMDKVTYEPATPKGNVFKLVKNIKIKLAEVLNESDARWRSLVKNAPNIIMVLDQDGEILFINRTVAGLTIEQTIGKKVYEFVPADFHEKVRSAIEQVYKTGEMVEYETLGTGPDGTLSWYLSRVGPVRYRDRIISVMLIATDITGRRRTEENLRESEQKYHSLCDASPDFIYILDKNGIILDTNPTALSRLGYDKDELIGFSLQRIFTPRSRKIFAKEFPQNLKQMHKCPDLELVAKNGEVIKVDCFASPVLNKKGELERLVVYERDITRRKQTEGKLRKSEQRMKTVLKNINDIIFQLSPEGRILYVSPKVKDIYGYKPEELIGRHFSKTTPKDDVPRALWALNSVLSGKVLRNFEICQVDKNGDLVHMELNAVPVRKKGKIVAAEGVMRDITEYKMTEESAAQILRSLMPAVPPQVENIGLSWKFIPCKKMGGDIFNVFKIDEEHLAVFMLDVSGHGVCAAMVASSVSQLLRPQAGFLVKDNRIVHPGGVLKALDQEYPMERFGRYFTICYLILDIRSGSLKYSSAGHPPPLLLHKDGSLEALEKGGSIIGLGEVTPFEEEEKLLRPGEKVFVYTDGVLEYQNESGEFYGRGRFGSQLRNMKDAPVAKILDSVEEALMDFGNHAPPQDDITIMGIEFKGSQNRA